MSKKYWFCLLIIIGLGISSCQDDPIITTPPPDLGNSGSTMELFVVNEGGFGAGNASISILDIATDVMRNNVFEKENNFLLGDIAQSIYWEGNRAFIVVNNSQKIEVVDTEDFSSIQTIGGLSSPNFIAPMKGDRFLVSELFNENLTIINEADGSIDGTIELVCPQPDDMSFNCGNDRLITVDDYVYIGNKGTGALMRTSVSGSEINPVDDVISLSGTPKDMVLDLTGTLWVLTFDFGDSANNTLYGIDPESFSIVSEASIGAIPFASVNMTINEAGDMLYFNEGSFSSMSIDEDWASRKTIYDNPDEIGVYGFIVDEEETFLYLGDQADYASPSQVIKVDLATGLEENRYDVGVLPSKFYFR